MYSFDKVLHFMRQLQTEAIISAAKAQSKARKVIALKRQQSNFISRELQTIRQILQKKIIYQDSHRSS